LSEDPIHFAGGSNFYRYARNRSIKRRDPLGLCPVDDCRTKAVLAGLAHVGIDAIGLFPGGGAVSAAIDAGDDAFDGFEFVSDVLSTGFGLVETSDDDGISTGLGVTSVVIDIAKVAKDGAEILPVAGTIISAVSMAVDVIDAGMDWAKCAAGGG
jgi:hypothetical protein